jgi:5-methylcytosine-specific restriction endonuclease McrBC regulatory subunit McrC
MQQNARAVIELTLANPIAISKAAESISWTGPERLKECQSIIDFHWRSYGTKSIGLIYNPSEGFTLTAYSGVGALSSNKLVLKVAPKIPNIGIEKVLSMAQYAGMGLWKIGNGQISAQIDESDDYSLNELLGFALVDAVGDVINNGLQREFEDTVERTLVQGSGPDLVENMSTGFTPPLYMTQSIQNFDILSNQVLKAAILSVKRHSRNQNLKVGLERLLTSFEDVTATFSNEDLDTISNISFSLPRADYQKALAVGVAILRGKTISLDESSSTNIPNFMLDMDYVFEAFCSRVLVESFKGSHFEVLCQQKYPHLSTPDFQAKSIIPDVVIRHRSSGKSVVLDLKNKYTSISDLGRPSIGNSDLFQQTYYQGNLGATCAVLVYPSSKPEWQFPLPGSEGIEAYNQKVLASLSSSKYPQISIAHGPNAYNILALQVDLSGPLKNTINSLKRVAFLVRHLLTN